MASRLSDDVKIDAVTSAMDDLRLVRDKAEHCLKRLNGPNNGPSKAHALPWSAADLQGSPAGSLASSCDSVSLRGSGRPQYHRACNDSPAASTASSSASVPLRSPAASPQHQPRAHGNRLPSDLLSKASTEASVCLSSTKGPAAHQSRAAAAPACLSSTKGPVPAAYHGPRAAAATSLPGSPRSPLGLDRHLASAQQPPSAGLTPVTEPTQKVPFLEWAQRLDLGEDTNFSGTPCSDGPGASGLAKEEEEAPPSACLSIVSKMQPRMSYEEWRLAGGATAAVGSPASTLRPVPFLE